MVIITLLIVISFIALVLGLAKTIYQTKEETLKEKKLPTLEDNVRIIKNWITFFGVLTVISLVISFIWVINLFIL